MPDNNSDDHIPKGEVIGVIIGAVCILLLISLVPLYGSHPLLYYYCYLQRS